MRVATNSATLYDAIKAIKRGVASKATLPILKNVHMRAVATDDCLGVLTLTTTNLEIALRASVPCTVAESGEATIPLAYLHEWLSLSPLGETVTLATGERHDMTVTMARDRMHLRGIDSEDYPAIPASDTANYIGSIDAGELSRILSETVPYIGRDKWREQLHGVCLATRTYDDASPGWIHAYATDGYRASNASAYLDDSDASPDAPARITIPGDAIKAMLPMLKECAASAVARLSVTPTRNQIIIDIDGVSIVSRLSDGEYPLDGLLTEFAASATGDIVASNTALQGALKRALALSEDKDTFVSLAVATGATEYDHATLTVTCGENIDTIDCASHGTIPASATYNVRYLSDALKGYKATGKGKNKTNTVALYFSEDRLRLNCVAFDNGETNTGERIVMRVFSPIESKRREYRTPGAHCSLYQFPYGDGAKTAIGYYNYGAPTPEVFAADIARHSEAYAASNAELDTIMCDAWEGYTAPATYATEATRDETALLIRAQECYTPYVHSEYGDALDDMREREHNARMMVVSHPQIIDASPDAPAYACVDLATGETVYVESRDMRLLLAAHSAVTKSVHPYGLPIAEDCAPMLAVALWRAHCDALTLATRHYDGRYGQDAPCVYEYGEHISIKHYRACLMTRDGIVRAMPEAFDTSVRYRDGEARGVVTMHHASLRDALTHILSSVPSRASKPPGVAVNGDASPDTMRALWRSLVDSIDIRRYHVSPDEWPMMFGHTRNPGYAPVAASAASARDDASAPRQYASMFDRDDCAYDPIAPAVAPHDAPATMFDGEAWRDSAARMARVAAVLYGDASPVAVWDAIASD